MHLLDVLSTIRNIVYFDETNYIEQNQDTSDAVLAQKHDKKSLQLILCGGGISAGIMASFITGSTSILCSALSARHANVLRQQQKLLVGIQLAREEKWLREAATMKFPFAEYSTADADTPFLKAGGLIVIQRVTVVPRSLSRSASRHSPNEEQPNCCSIHTLEKGKGDLPLPEDASHTL